MKCISVMRLTKHIHPINNNCKDNIAMAIGGMLINPFNLIIPPKKRRFDVCIKGEGARNLVASGRQPRKFGNRCSRSWLMDCVCVLWWCICIGGWLRSFHYHYLYCLRIYWIILWSISLNIGVDECRYTVLGILTIQTWCGPPNKWKISETISPNSENDKYKNIAGK